MEEEIIEDAEIIKEHNKKEKKSPPASKEVRESGISFFFPRITKHYNLIFSLVLIKNDK